MNHFTVSMVKSVLRILAGGVLAYAGYELWAANDYTDIVIAYSGYLMMFAGIGLLMLMSNPGLLG